MSDRARRLWRGLGALGLILFGLVAFTPLPNVWYAHRAAAAGPGAASGPAQAIVVLGAGVDPDGLLTDDSLRRAVQGIRLWRAGKAPRLLLLGPSEGGRASEASVRAALARDLGVPAAAVLLGEHARTTREEAAESAALLRPLTAQRVLLVTGSHHMPRARGLFERQGFEVVPRPVDEGGGRSSKPEARLQAARRLVQESAARLFYHLRGAL